MRAQLLPRVLGLLTLGYGAYTAARPESLVRAAGLTDESPSCPSGRVLGTVIGDAVAPVAAQQHVAPAGAPLQAAIVARVACDLSDMAGFGLAGPPRTRAKVAGIAAGWGLLCASSFTAARARR